MGSIPQKPERRHLPAAVDYNAATKPDETYVYLPKGDQIKDGFEPLNWRRYAKAINEIAWWLDEHLGGTVTGNDFPTIAYVGPNDVRYSMVILGASKTKRTTLLPFPANTVHSQTNLLNHAKCKYVVFGTSPNQGWIDTLAGMPDVKSVQLPEVAAFLHDRPIQHYKITRGFEEAIDDPFYVCQTSGTTGNPKPIVITNRNGVDYFESNAGTLTDPELGLAPFLCIKDAYIPLLLPMSWIAGISPLLHFTTDEISSTPVVMPSTMPQPMTAAYLKEAIMAMPRGKKNGVFVTPDPLQEVARDVSILEELRSFDWVAFAGAPLDHPTGDIISRYTRVQSMIGSTDTGIYPTLYNAPEDWKLVRFHPDHQGWHLEHYNEDLYELCVSRQPHDPRYAFQIDPHVQNYHTKDLFRSVAGRPGYYANAGRIDDFVKLRTMTKFSATNIEAIINRHPGVKKSLVGGDARERSFAIVEPKTYDGRSATEILEELWPAFEAANELVFGEASLVKELVLVTDPERPIKQTAKGSVDRRTTIARYEKEIEEMYEEAGFAVLLEGADRTIR